MEFLSKLKLASNKVSIGESTGKLILPTPEGNDIELIGVDSNGSSSVNNIKFLYSNVPLDDSDSPFLVDRNIDINEGVVTLHQDALCGENYLKLTPSSIEGDFQSEDVSSFKIDHDGISRSYDYEYNSFSFGVANGGILRLYQSYSNMAFSYELNVPLMPVGDYSLWGPTSFVINFDPLKGLPEMDIDNLLKLQSTYTISSLLNHSDGTQKGAIVLNKLNQDSEILKNTIYTADSIIIDDKVVSLPEKEGTIALVEDLPDTSNFVDKTCTAKVTLNSDLEADRITAKWGLTVCGCIDVKTAVTTNYLYVGLGNEPGSIQAKGSFTLNDDNERTILNYERGSSLLDVGVPIQYTGSEDIVISDNGGDYDSGSCSCSGSDSTVNSTPVFVTDKAVVDYVNDKLEDFNLNGFEFNFPIEGKCGYIKTSSGSLEFYDGSHNLTACIGLCQALNIVSCKVDIYSDETYFSKSVPTVRSGLTIDKDVQLTTKKYVDDSINSKLGTVFRYKGNSTYEGLPQKSTCSSCTGGLQVGDVYNLTSASGDYKVGDNVVWDGSAWDKLAATVDLSGYLTTENAEDTYIKRYSSDPQLLHGELYICGGLLVGNASVSTTLEANNANFISNVNFKCGSTVKFYSASDVEFCCPVDFKGTVSINELAVQELSIENLSVGEEITVNNVPVVGSIEALQKKTGVFTQVLPAKTASNGTTVEYQVVFNTDSTKTVLAPPNVVVTDITGAREKYVLVTTEWDENTVYLTFDEGSVKANTYKVYITNIQLA